ncbi:hypothetical protein CEXT_40071 [Caerostris extrusa]|uniref:Uncharacterized protein n=1 Tax=Caerostris extrusa TaxID=172846 RepID=A0AAV4MSX1_CAEEX|nr:hypothetical protein CEXT_40071 [Caerostris extrusa]
MLVRKSHLAKDVCHELRCFAQCEGVRYLWLTRVGLLRRRPIVREESPGFHSEPITATIRLLELVRGALSPNLTIWIASEKENDRANKFSLATLEELFLWWASMGNRTGLGKHGIEAHPIRSI